jgi:anaerobic magnesium-protoporphyrin IX monomethyl ester cyclase
MKVLLISMPDSNAGLNALMRVPNLGICSIAGNLDGCRTRVLDLALYRGRLEPLLRRVLGEFRPDLVGLSAMSFQFESARRAARIAREAVPGVRVVLGGYHASLLSERIAREDTEGLFDFLVRGEGERTMALLVKAIGGGSGGYGGIAGLSYREYGAFRHNPDAALLDLAALRPPDRSLRVLDSPRFLHMRFDCAETSRGCTMGCTFCSIRRMYGRSIRFFDLERVIADLRSLQARGTRGVFFVDDNITLDVPRLKDLCRRIVAEGLQSMHFVMQASVAGIASDPELPPLLAAANVRWIFLGIESGIERNLRQMRKAGVLAGSRRAVRGLRACGICVIGGFIVGNPDDTKRDIRDTYRYAFSLRLDHAIVQCITPYPGTELRERLLAEGLVVNPDDFSRYTGFQCNVRTRTLDARALNRWMILYGLALYFNPAYFLPSRVWWSMPANAPRMLLNNFRFLWSGLRGRLFRSTHRW